MILKQKLLVEKKFSDDRLTGFGFRYRPSGKHAYYLEYSLSGSQRFFTIGYHGVLTPDAARKIATVKSAEVLNGTDIQEAKQTLRKEKSKAQSLDQLIERYLTEGKTSKPNKRASSWEQDNIALKRHASPLLGQYKIESLTPQLIEKWQADVASGATAKMEKTKKQGKAIIKGGAGCAGRALSTMSAMFNWAIKQGITEKNPVKGVVQLKCKQRDRILSESEIADLWTSLDNFTSEGIVKKKYIDILKLLILTGARQSEIRCLSWNEIDLDNNLFRLEPKRHKSGQIGKFKTIPITPQAKQVILGIKKAGQYLFPQSKKDTPIEKINKPFKELFKKCSLEDVTPHTLRHTAGSMMAISGIDIATIASVLGHTRLETSRRYIHLDNKTQIKAAAILQSKI